MPIILWAKPLISTDRYGSRTALVAILHTVLAYALMIYSPLINLRITVD